MNNILHRPNAILLERSRGIVSTDFRLWTQRIGASHALRAVPARPRDPFDADPVSDFDAFVFAAGTEFCDFAYAFVAAYLAGLGGVGEGGPLLCRLLFFSEGVLGVKGGGFRGKRDERRASVRSSP